MNTGRKDLFWSYSASFMRILAGVVIMPFSLRMLAPEMQGIWQIFLNTISIITLFDFGFANSFSRNVTYVFSGVKDIKTTGYEAAEINSVDYGLLKSLLKAMRTYYGIMALLFILIFSVASPFYLTGILKNYSGNHQTVWIAWFIFGASLAYELYTLYYNSILSGRGKIKQQTKIVVLSQLLRIVLSVVLLLCGLDLYALIIGVFAADLLNRTLAYNSFYDKALKKELAGAVPAKPVMDIIKILAPNSFKLGLTTLGNICRNKIIMYLAPFFLPLPIIGSYGITMQITSMIGQVAVTWFGTFYPQLSQYTIQKRTEDVKRLYIKALFFLFAVYILLGAGFILFGQDILILLKSRTLLLGGFYIFAALLFSALDNSQLIATALFISHNEVPHYRSYLAAGGLTVLFCIIMFMFDKHITPVFGVWSLILSAGLATACYILWKWPLEAAKYLNLKWKDIFVNISEMCKEYKDLFMRKISGTENRHA